jgi:hypothetical protein
MASAHGAGLMLVPVLVQMRGDGMPSALAHSEHAAHHAVPRDSALNLALIAVGVHTAAMLAVAGVIAFIVYQKVGVEILRRAWINLDLLWVGTLAATGGITLAASLWPFLPH